MHHSKGFSIVELMIVLGIAGIVVALGVPSFVTTVQDSRIRSQAFEVANLLAYARSEAAKRPNTTVTVCPAANATESSGCSNVNTWENGWIVLSDVNGDRIFNSGSDRVLKISSTLSGSNRLRTSGFGGLNYIQFNSQGLPANAGTFIVCDSRGTSKARALVMTAAGQVRMAVDENNDGVPNNHAGTNITCP